MSLLDGMKDKLGFGSKPEWQDDYPDDGYVDDGYADDGYVDDGSYADDGYADDGGYADEQEGGRIVSFDAYNPDKFEHVKVASSSTPRVASYDDLGTSRSSTRNYGRSVGTSSARSSYGSSHSGAVGTSGSWSAPEDPSFLDNPAPARSRDIYETLSSPSLRGSSDQSASDPYSSLGSDIVGLHRDPATHLSIVRPKEYADVEKIANAVKAGKSVVLVVSETKPALAKRILDFTFGAASALNLNVDKAAERIFVISKGTEMLSAEEREYLKKQGVLK